MASNLARLRKICLSLPHATEVEAWGSPTFRVGKIFAMYAEPNNHHGDGREGVWINTSHVDQDLLIRGMPDRYFIPAYVGPYGWTGVYLDARTDWASLIDLLRDSYRRSASKKLAAALTDDAPAPSPLKTVAKKKRATKKTVATKSRVTKRAPARRKRVQ